MAGGGEVTIIWRYLVRYVASGQITKLLVQTLGAV